VGFDVRNTFLKVKRASEKHHKAVEKRHDAAVKRYEGNNTVASKLEVEPLATELSDASLEMECDREASSRIERECGIEGDNGIGPCAVHSNLTEIAAHIPPQGL
jgi:hypothetical protein